MNFDTNALESWFKGWSKSNPDRPSYWVLYRGNTTNKNQIIASNEVISETGESFEMLLEAIQQQEALGGNRAYCIKYKTANTDSTPKTTVIKPKGFGMNGQQQQNGIYGMPQNLIGDIHGLYKNQITSEIRGITESYELKLKHYEERTSMQREIDDLKSENASLRNGTLMERLAERCMPLVEAVSNNVAEKMMLPQPTTQIGLIKEPPEANTPKPTPQRTTVDFNAVVTATMTLRKVEPDAERFLIDMANFAVKNPQKFAIAKASFYHLINEDGNNDNTPENGSGNASPGQ